MTPLTDTDRLRPYGASGNPSQPGIRAKVLVVVDVPDWIFERHAETLQQGLADEFDLRICYRGDVFDEDEYDLLYPLEWDLVEHDEIRCPDKWVTGIRSHVSWQDVNPAKFGALLRDKFSAVHAVSKRLQTAVGGFRSDIALLSHGVRLDRFRAGSEPFSRPGPVVIGWAGNRKAPAKGFEAFIAPLASLTNVNHDIDVELRFCGYSDELIDYDGMREFYEGIDIYVCSSSSESEGNNNSLLEAAAMGRAIVTTDTGTVDEYLEDGVSALIVQRTPEAVRSAVERLAKDPALGRALGRQAAQAVQTFSWENKLAEHRAWLRGCLAKAVNTTTANTPYAMETRIQRLLAQGKSARRPTTQSSLGTTVEVWLDALDEGEELLREGHAEEALRRLLACQKGKEDDPALLAAIGIGWMRTGDAASARSFFSRALELLPASRLLRELVEPLPGPDWEGFAKIIEASSVTSLAPRATPARPRIHVAMLTFNALSFTRVALESLSRTARLAHRIWILDNGSRDGTRSWLAAQDASHVRVELGECNLGVPGGRNRLIDMALPEMGDDDFLVFADNDMEFFPGWDETALSFLDSHPEVGILSSDGHRLMVRDDERILSPKSLHTAQVDVACGGYLCWVRTSALRKVGGFDENLGLFWHEDDDFTIHVLANGYEAFAAPETPVLHRGHKSDVAMAGIDEGGSRRNQSYLCRKWREAGLIDANGAVRRGGIPGGLRQKGRSARAGEVLLAGPARWSAMASAAHEPAPRPVERGNHAIRETVTGAMAALMATLGHLSSGAGLGRLARALLRQIRSSGGAGGPGGRC